MRKAKDLTGKTFDRWFVVGRAKDQVSSSGKHRNMWACMCSCGGENSIKAVREDGLKSGHSKSCGCLQKEKSSKAYTIDMTGKRFNRWLVLGRGTNDKYGQPMWKCKCDCKTEREVLGSSLRSGVSQSCGCLNKEINSKANLKDLTGLQFSRWSVIKEQGRNSEGSVMWLCECSCDLHTKRVVKGSDLRSGHSKSCGCLQKEMMSETNSGENNWNWKDGITPLQDKIRFSVEYKQWYTQVFERDNYICRYSGEQGVLSCHHIKPFHVILEENNITTLEDALKCEELWDTDNGITLLFEYHSQTSNKLNAFHKVYGTHSTEEDFYGWFAGRLVI